ncbi:MFS transporter [Rhodococcus opacus]|uniref:MFS transporter n=1 Tax=Rhodococcus opacus TaxID=37919 RepID=A0AAX3Y8T6_RHOOP|nr:MFS transporter [Rhodococcus opacus]MCZ4589972.1 MFS transporter [Rhodococcus opacus]WLF44497.1 MFS transporter [Rhodococcus opacus]
MEQANNQIPLSAVDVTLNPGYSYGSHTLAQDVVHLSGWVALLGAAGALAAGILARRVGPWLPLLLGLMSMVALGLAYVAISHHNWVLFLLLGLPMGVAAGLYSGALPNLLVEAVPAESQGVSAGITSVASGLWEPSAFTDPGPTQPQSDRRAYRRHGHSAAQTIPQIFSDHGYANTFV